VGVNSTGCGLFMRTRKRWGASGSCFLQPRPPAWQLEGESPASIDGSRCRSTDKCRPASAQTSSWRRRFPV